MRRISINQKSWRALTSFLLMALFFLFFPVINVRAQEFVIFTKTQDQRFPSCSSASAPQCERFNAGQPPCSAGLNLFSCRGYDPTKNLSSGLSTPVNCADLQSNCPAPPDGALELFMRLGPGEATGNMHGRIQGVNGKLCKEVSSDPASTFCSGVGNINLGIEKFNPKSQDDNAPCVGILNTSSSTGTGDPNPAEDCNTPTGNGVNTAGMSNGSHGFSEQFLRNDDFAPGAIEHAAFQFSSNFKWMDESDLAGKCNGNRANMAQHTSNCTYATQTVRQITGLEASLGIGTLTAPGAGDQVAEIDILGWSARNTGDLYTTPGNAAAQSGTGSINPRIDWKQTFVDPNFSGLSGFQSEQHGAFTYCHGAHNTSGDPCSTVVLPDAIYPTGTSQTTGDFKSCLHYDSSTGITGGTCP